MGFTPLLEMIFVSHIFRCERRFEGSNRGCKGDSKAQIGNEDNMHLWGWGIFFCPDVGRSSSIPAPRTKENSVFMGFNVGWPFLGL